MYRKCREPGCWVRWRKEKTKEGASEKDWLVRVGCGAGVLGVVAAELALWEELVGRQVASMRIT